MDATETHFFLKHREVANIMANHHGKHQPSTGFHLNVNYVETTSTGRKDIM